MVHAKIYFPNKYRSKGLGIDASLSLSTNLSKEDAIQFKGIDVGVKVNGYGNNGKCEVLHCKVVSAPEDVLPILQNAAYPNLVLSASQVRYLYDYDKVKTKPIKPYIMHGTLDLAKNEELAFS